MDELTDMEETKTVIDMYAGGTQVSGGYLSDGLRVEHCSDNVVVKKGRERAHNSLALTVGSLE